MMDSASLRAKAEAVPSRKWHHHADDVQMFYGGRDSQGITEFTDACSPATVLGLLDELDALMNQKNPRCQRSMWYEEGHQSCVGSDGLGCGCPCHSYALDIRNTELRGRLDAAEALVARWRTARAHTYASENADEYRAHEGGLRRAADELEAALEDNDG